MKKILGLLAGVLIFSGCLAEAERDQSTETNAETQRADSLAAVLDSLDAITAEALQEQEQEQETNSETQNSTELEELQARFDSLEGIRVDTLVIDTLVSADVIDTSLVTCAANSFTISEQINEKTFTGCVDLITSINFYKNGVFHRENGPAVESADGGKSWWLNGVLHREDGPAVEYDDVKEWYLNGKRHREDGPSLEYANGSKEWYLNGERHREDGPAVESADGGKSWWLNGEWLSEQEFNAILDNV